MIRPVLTEFALFLAPFAIYALYLWGTRANVIHPKSWPLPTLAWLSAAALALMAGSFIVLAQWGGEPAGSHYVPAHIENGRLVPGTRERVLPGSRRSRSPTCPRCSTATA